MHTGDVIYFSKDGSPCYGTVIAVGEHGVQVDHDGETCRVLHDDILGHKARAKRKLTLIDHGEDGYIAKDEDGRHVYVRGRLPDDPGEPMAKSLTAQLSQPEIDLALLKAGFVPDLGYIQKSYGAHWNLPESNAPLVEELRAEMLEVSRSNAEVASSVLAAIEALSAKIGD